MKQLILWIILWLLTLYGISLSVDNWWSSLIFEWKCWIANGISTYNAPTTNLCNAWNASSVKTYYFNYTWTCGSINWWKTASCSAPKKINWVCWDADWKTYKNNPPTYDLCNAWVIGGIKKNSNNYTWTCYWINWGNNYSCSAIRLACWPANWHTYTSWPSNSYLCQVWSVSNKWVGTIVYNWNCINAGYSVSCQAHHPHPCPPWYQTWTVKCSTSLGTCLNSSTRNHQNWSYTYNWKYGYKRNCNTNEWNVLCGCLIE